jgi:hypothetical protein
MGFGFGQAVVEYAGKTHPRVVWSAGEREQLVTRTAQGDYAQIRTALMAGAREDARRIHDGITGTLIALNKAHAPAPVKLERLAAAAWLEPQDQGLFDAAVKCVRWMLASYTPQGQRDYVDAGGHGLALAYDLLYDRLTGEDLALLATWLVEKGVKRTLARLEGVYLRCPGGNLPLVGMVQALINLLAVWGDPGVGDLTRERDLLVQYLDASLQATTGPAGYPAEDIGYGTLCAARLFIGASLAGRAGWYDIQEHCPQFLGFGRAMLHFVQPWGKNLTNTGDHGDDFGLREFVLARLATINQDPTLLWLLGTLSYGGHLGTPEVTLPDGRNVPASWQSLAVIDDLGPGRTPADGVDATAYFDMSRGLVSFRSGWGPDATYLHLDGGHRPTLAQGHEHDAGGHFGLSAMGEYFAISPGRYNIEQSSHNLMLVDGKSGQSTGGEWRAAHYRARLTGYQPDGFVDAASCDNSQQSNCYWSYRTVGLVKGDEMPAYAWTLDDVNADHGKVMPREYWWTMHTCPGNEIHTGVDRATVLGRAQGSALDVFWATPDAKGLPAPYVLTVTQDEATPSSYGYVTPEMIAYEKQRQKDAPWKQVHHAVYFRPRLIAKVSGPNGKVLSLMVPRAKGAPEPEFKRLANLDGQVAVSLRVGDIQDTIICAYGHRLLTAGDIDARGDWVVVRRRVSTGQVLRHKVSGGDWVKVGGRRL